MNLEVKDWERYFEIFFPKRVTFKFNLIDVRHPMLDANISSVEIVLALRKCKSQKAPGLAGISNDARRLSEISYVNVLRNRQSK